MGYWGGGVIYPGEYTFSAIPIHELIAKTVVALCPAVSTGLGCSQAPCGGIYDVAVVASRCRSATRSVLPRGACLYGVGPLTPYIDI